jgi:Ca-activated chloride channel family protein
MNRVRKALIAGSISLAVACALLGQDAPIRQLSVDVDIVLVPVTVTNDRGQFVGGLEKQHFQVYEDKVEQSISSFSTEDSPMSLGIVLDSSGSMSPVSALARRNGGACTDVGAADDEYFLIVFADKLKVNTDFTSDLQKLRMTLLTVQSKGSTALYDAIYAGLAKVKEGSHPRKALVVVSDGVDNRSRYTGKNVREAVKESDVQLYLIGNDGDGALSRVAEDTGGRSLASRTRAYELGNICSEIVKELKNQYVLGYRPTNQEKDGKWRNISVKLTPPPGIGKLNSRPKRGYTAPSLQ